MKKEDKLVLKHEKIRNKTVKKLVNLIKDCMKLNAELEESGLFNHSYNMLVPENNWYQIEHLMCSLCMTAGIMAVRPDDMSHIRYSQNSYTKSKLNEILEYWNDHYSTTCKYLKKGKW